MAPAESKKTPKRNGSMSPPERRQEIRPPAPPVRKLMVWLIILFVVPLTLYFMNPRRATETEQLVSSQFEDLLLSGRVTKCTILQDPTTGMRTIVGTYMPETSEGTATGEKREFQVEVAYSDALDQMIRQNCPNREVKTKSNLWGNILMSILPIVLLIAVIYFLFSRQLKAAGRGALQFGKSRAHLMAPNQERVTFEDVSGIEEAKEEVQEIIDYLRDPHKFQRLGGRIPKGVLMIGPPGTGKTLLARAIAGEADVPFFSISGSDFVEMFVGVGASRVRDMFEEGKRHAPCIIFIDEIDAVGRSRFSGIGGGHDEREQTLNALLVEMDGFESNAGIIVIAATNRPDVLDPALLRPGRFDRQITIDLPDVKGRLGILRVHAKKVKIANEGDLEVVARGTPGYSGADLANLINEAALLAARLDKSQIELSDLEEARDKVRWGKERRSRSIDERDRRVTAFHEAGHALVSMLCARSVPLHKVTIVPRGTAYLGATMHLPERDRYTQSRSELESELAVLMGGRIAEELIFKDITSGAAADIRQATDISKKMVCQWGMSDKMGAMSYSGREEHIFLGRDITRSEDYSEVTAREIDQEVRRIVDDAYNFSKKLLTENYDKLLLLGNTLLEKETMSAGEIRALLGLNTPAPPDEGTERGIDIQAATEPKTPPPAPAEQP